MYNAKQVQQAVKVVIAIVAKLFTDWGYMVKDKEGGKVHQVCKFLGGIYPKRFIHKDKVSTMDLSICKVLQLAGLPMPTMTDLKAIVAGLREQGKRVDFTCKSEQDVMDYLSILWDCKFDPADSRSRAKSPEYAFGIYSRETNQRLLALPDSMMTDIVDIMVNADAE